MREFHTYNYFGLIPEITLLIGAIILATPYSAFGSESPEQPSLSRTVAFSAPQELAKVHRIAVMPFWHEKGPYFGESCRRNFSQRLIAAYKSRLNFLPTEIALSTGAHQSLPRDKDFSVNSGLEIAKSLNVDASLFGYCTAGDISISIIRNDGAVLCDARPLRLNTRDHSTSTPGSLSDLNYSMRTVIGGLVQDTALGSSIEIQSSTPTPYKLPLRVAILPITGLEDHGAKSLRDEIYNKIATHLEKQPLEVTDSALRDIFGKSDSSIFETISVASMTAHLGVDAVISVHITETEKETISISVADVAKFLAHIDQLPREAQWTKNIPLSIPIGEIQHHAITIIVHGIDGRIDGWAQTNFSGSSDIAVRMLPAWAQ